MNEQDYLDIVLQPLFINGDKGKLFCLYTPPKNNATEVVLFLPAFAEEMNRCRVMVAMQARMLAARGYGCLLLDYYGTGDSAGDFTETSWEQWYSDAISAYDWLIDQGHQHIALWGIRTGALLAAELANENVRRFSRVLLWQPVLDGKTYWTHFFRIRLAKLIEQGTPKETTQQMRQHLQEGNDLEISHYIITPKLFTSLENKKLANYQNISIPIYWFETSIDSEGNISLVSQKLIDTWQQQAIKVETYAYQGQAFWLLYERQLAPELLEKMTALFI